MEKPPPAVLSFSLYAPEELSITQQRADVALNADIYIYIADRYIYQLQQTHSYPQLTSGQAFYVLTCFY